MKHVFWIYPGEVAGRPGPGLSPWRLHELKAGGLDAVLSVASDLFAHSEVISAGLIRTCMPLPDVGPPDRHVAEVCAAVLPLTFRFIEANVRQGRRILVHCAAGNDRTGLVLSHYIAKREGISAPEAILRLRAVRPGALSSAGWEEMAVRLIPEVLRRTEGEDVR